MRNVDLAAVDELDDELKVVEADVLRHDDGRVFAGIRQQEFLEVGAAGRQHYLKHTEKKKNALDMKTRRRSRLNRGSRLNLDTRAYQGDAEEAFVHSDCFHFASGKRAKTTVVCSIEFLPHSKLSIDVSISYQDIKNQKAFTA